MPPPKACKITWLLLPLLLLSSHFPLSVFHSLPFLPLPRFPNFVCCSGNLQSPCNVAMNFAHCFFGFHYLHWLCLTLSFIHSLPEDKALCYTCWMTLFQQSSSTAKFPFLSLPPSFSLYFSPSLSLSLSLFFIQLSMKSRPDPVWNSLWRMEREERSVAERKRR